MLNFMKFHLLFILYHKKDIFKGSLHIAVEKEYIDIVRLLLLNPNVNINSKIILDFI